MTDLLTAPAPVLTPAAVAHAAVLQAIGGGAVASLRDLAEAAGRPQKNIGRELDGVVAAGLADRDTLRLTDAGREAVAALDRAEGRGGAERGVMRLRHDQVVPDPDNARDDAAEADLDDLVRSLADKGIQSPVGVRAAPEPDGRHRLVWGERRWRAWGRLVAEGAWAADRAELCRVVKARDEAALAEASLVENEQRANLNPMQRARAFERIALLGRDNAAIARMIGRTPEHIQQHRRLLRLDAEQQVWVADGRLSIHEALRLLAAPKKAEEPEPALPDDDEPELFGGDPQVGPNEPPAVVAAAPRAVTPQPAAAMPPSPPVAPPSADAADAPTPVPPRVALAVLELAAKSEAEGVDLPSGDRGARVGAYWLDAAASEAVQRRLIQFLMPGGGLGWHGVVTAAGHAWRRTEWGDHGPSDEGLRQARASAGAAPNVSGYATSWLNVAPASASAVTAKEAEPQTDEAEADEAADLLADVRAACGEVIAPGEFRALLERSGLLGPFVAHDGDNAGGVFDANEDEAATVDVNRELPDALAQARALLLAAALNASAGFAEPIEAR